MGECCCGSTQPIEVYVELAGKQDYHVSLKGRDEADQHPISAITNLQDSLDEIQDNLSEIETIIDERTGTALHYKGQVTDYNSLPVSGNKIGDVYNVVDTGANYLWTGNGWDDLSPVAHLDDYVTKEYFEGALDASVKLLQDHLQVHYYEKSEIDDFINNINSDISTVSTSLIGRITEASNALQEQIDSINTAITGAITYKGKVASRAALPNNAQLGNAYKTEDTSDIYFWDGIEWSLLEQGTITDIYTKDEIDELLNTKADASDVEEIGAQVSALGDTVDKLEEETQEAKTWYDLDDVINS